MNLAEVVGRHEYRSAFTLFALVLALDQIWKQLVLHFYPFERMGSPFGPKVTMVLLGLTIASLAVSLWGSRSNAESRRN